jgi:molybdopterin synthase sulfur carrier subunit
METGSLVRRNSRSYLWCRVMKIRYFARIRELTGENEVEWDKPADTLGMLMHDLADHYGQGFRRRVLADAGLSSMIIVLINGHDARHLGGAEAPLRADDTVSIFPPIGGG